MKWTFCVLAALAALRAQTVTVEADPDLYFDRGITFAAGVKPNRQSRWTFLGDFASRKVGPIKDGERLQWRFGETTRSRFLGERNSLFGQIGISYGQFRAKDQTTFRGFSLRPSLGVQWFPWEANGFYLAPQVGVENYPGRSNIDKRVELRVGWQF